MGPLATKYLPHPQYCSRAMPLHLAPVLGGRELDHSSTLELGPLSCPSGSPVLSSQTPCASGCSANCALASSSQVNAWQSPTARKHKDQEHRQGSRLHQQKQENLSFKLQPFYFPQNTARPRDT